MTRKQISVTGGPTKQARLHYREAEYDTLGRLTWRESIVWLHRTGHGTEVRFYKRVDVDSLGRRHVSRTVPPEMRHWPRPNLR